jgi:hypothetical protein
MVSPTPTIEFEPEELETFDDPLQQWPSIEPWIEEVEGFAPLISVMLGYGGKSHPLTDEEIFLKDLMGAVHYVNYYQHQK